MSRLQTFSNSSGSSKGRIRANKVFTSEPRAEAFFTDSKGCKGVPIKSNKCVGRSFSFFGGRGVLGLDLSWMVQVVICKQDVCRVAPISTKQCASSASAARRCCSLSGGLVAAARPLRTTYQPGSKTNHSRAPGAKPTYGPKIKMHNDVHSV